MAAAIAVALLSLSGCQAPGSGEGSPPSSASPAGHEYSGQNLPPKVDQLSGTPFYNTSPELASRAKLDGAPFLLIAPLDPTRALLVVEQGTTPAELAKRPSEKADFSGTTEAVEAPQLVGYVKESTGLELKTDDDGKVVVLKVQKPALVPAASASPAGDSTPAPTFAPAPADVPVSVNTPQATATASPAPSSSPVATPGAQP